ncbi:MAG: RagB/SusD family nutrient uptake outer membrane protein [Chitinophagaceae bacterium]
MKHTYQAILFCTALFVFLGCKKVLDKSPLASQTTTALYNDPSQAILGINGIYDAISWSTEWRNTDFPVMEWMYGDILSNDAEKGSTASDMTNLQTAKNWAADASNSVVYVYSVLYEAIYRANVALSELPSADWDSDLKTRLMGEAHFLRGYSYFHLLRLFGGVSVVTAPLAVSEMNIPRSTFSETARQAEADFSYADSVLPLKSAYASADLGRATKGAAEAYLARMYMYEMGTDNSLDHTWQEVYDMTKKIMQSGEYSLYDNYAALTQEVSENGAESLFELQYSESSTSWGTASLGSYNNVYQLSRASWGWGFNNPTTSLRNEFEANDPRLACTMFGNGDTIVGIVQTVNYPTENATGYLNAKAAIIQPTFNTQAAGQNIRKIRYADVLLMNAEAAAHLGDNSEAVDLVNQIRTRARKSTRPMGTNVNNPTEYATANTPSGTLPDLSTSLSGDALLKAIWHERRVEMGMEAIHFWDMVRTGTYLDSLSTSVKANCEKHCITSGVVNPIPVLPIPLTEVQAWGLTQNPGY